MTVGTYNVSDYMQQKYLLLVLKNHRSVSENFFYLIAGYAIIFISIIITKTQAYLDSHCSSLQSKRAFSISQSSPPTPK